MKHLGSLVAVLLVCAVSWGCQDTHSVSLNTRPSAVIVGSGRLVSESRPVSGFSAISVSGAARLVVVQSGAESLSVTAEDNILPLVRTEVVGDRLVLDFAPAASISTSRGIVFEVSARALRSVDVTGAARVELTGLETNLFSLDVSGAAEVTGAGTVRDLQLKLSGAVRCQLEGLASWSALANVSGTSYARLRVAESLAANASGVSVVEYYGDPAVTANVSGASAVRRLGS